MTKSELRFWWVKITSGRYGLWDAFNFVLGNALRTLGATKIGKVILFPISKEISRRRACIKPECKPDCIHCGCETEAMIYSFKKCHEKCW